MRRLNIIVLFMLSVLFSCGVGQGKEAETPERISEEEIEKTEASAETTEELGTVIKEAEAEIDSLLQDI